MQNTEIIDDYKHLNFRGLRNESELIEGKMVQLVDRNEMPKRWKWVELNQKWINAIKRSELAWVRVLNDKVALPIRFTKEEVAFINAISNIEEKPNGEMVYTLKLELTKLPDKEDIFYVKQLD
jgi:hypothetical protein